MVAKNGYQHFLMSDAIEEDSKEVFSQIFTTFLFTK
jgi:hypothetical protein